MSHRTCSSICSFCFFNLPKGFLMPGPVEAVLDADRWFLPLAYLLHMPNSHRNASRGSSPRKPERRNLNPPAWHRRADRKALLQNEFSAPRRDETIGTMTQPSVRQSRRAEMCLTSAVLPHSYWYRASKIQRTSKKESSKSNAQQGFTMLHTRKPKMPRTLPQSIF